MDVVAILGIVIAFGAVIGGNFLEGGHMAALVNTPATVIVIGGTFGAVILQTPLPRLQRAARMLSWVVVPPKVEMQDGIAKLKTWSKTARREGILGLEMNLRREQTNRLAGSRGGNRECQDREDQLDRAPHLRSRS